MSDQGYEAHLRVNQAIDAINDLYNMYNLPELLAPHAPDLVKAAAKLSTTAAAALAAKYKASADAAAS